MEIKPNRDLLLQLMLLHGLQRNEVAAITNRSESAVNNWLAPNYSQDVPDEVMQLLKFTIKATNAIESALGEMGYEKV